MFSPVAKNKIYELLVFLNPAFNRNFFHSKEEVKKRNLVRSRKEQKSRSTEPKYRPMQEAETGLQSRPKMHPCPLAVNIQKDFSISSQIWGIRHWISRIAEKTFSRNRYIAGIIKSALHTYLKIPVRCPEPGPWDVNHLVSTVGAEGHVTHGQHRHVSSSEPGHLHKIESQISRDISVGSSCWLTVYSPRFLTRHGR